MDILLGNVDRLNLLAAKVRFLSVSTSAYMDHVLGAAEADVIGLSEVMDGIECEIREIADSVDFETNKFGKQPDVTQKESTPTKTDCYNHELIKKAERILASGVRFQVEALVGTILATFAAIQDEEGSNNG